MRVYVASSWRNEFQPAVVAALREDGHDVYDFRNPAEGNNGFSWRSIDGDWQKWSPQQYIRAINHPLAEIGFRFDMSALKACEACVMVMPCGPSASMEMGWACGAGKKVLIYVPALREPDLMVKMADLVTDDLAQIRNELIKTYHPHSCHWCAQGLERVPSAVVPGNFVHLFTPHGRKRCTLKERTA
jgi:hypothetical protein